MTRNPWIAKIEAAADERSRRELLGEIGLFREKHLMDVPAQREAAWALSEVYHLLGQRDQAVHEAEQMRSLCLASPEVVGEERRFYEAQLAKVSGRPARAPRAERPAREERGPREERAPRAEGARGGLEEAIVAAKAGKWEAARAALGQGRGPKGVLVEVWFTVGAMIEQGRFDADVLGDLVGRIAEGFGAAPAPVAGSGPLGALLGAPVPARRESLLDALDAWAARHPDRVDELADAALADHVATSGLKAPAPWLATTVGRAVVAGGAATQARLAGLQAEGAWAVTCYGEEPFGLLVDVAKGAAGWSLVSLRRGVLPKGEPDDRRLWTLRLAGEAGEVLIAAAPRSAAAWDDRLAARLARRLAELAPRVAVIAPGDGNVGLRAACLAVDVLAVDADTADAVLAALAELPKAKARPAREPKEPRAERKGGEERAPRAERDAARAERGPGPLAVIAALFEGEEAPAAEAYAAPLGELRRVFKAFSVVRRGLTVIPADQADARLATLLRAVHAAAPAGVRLAEGASLAIHGAAADPNGEVAALLASGPESERYGGPGVHGLVGVVRELTAAGVSIDRVLSGLSRRERDVNAVLAALPAVTPGLWRLLVARDGRRGELWYVDGAGPESLAAGVQLLQEERPRVVLAADPEARAALAGVAGEALVDDVAAAATAMGAWPVVAVVEGAEVDEA